MISLFTREIITGLVSAVFATKPATQLAVLCLVYGMLLCLVAYMTPYKSRFCGTQEGLLTGCLCILCWAGCLSDLMSKNQNASRFETHLYALDWVIVIIVLCFLALIFVGLAYVAITQVREIERILKSKKQQVLLDLMNRERHRIKVESMGDNSSDDEIRTQTVQKLERSYNL